MLPLAPVLLAPVLAASPLLNDMLMKLKATEEKKLATAARKAEIVTKKQERQARLISSTEAKAAKAVAKAEKLCTKLAKAASAGVALTHSG